MMKGHITISKPSYSSGKEAICIALHDDISGVEFVELEMTLHDFAACLTGLSRVEMQFELRPTFVGKRREVKQEVVQMPKGYGGRDEAVAKKAVAALEIDGWQARLSDCLNHHRSQGDGKQLVTFIRFVDAETDA